MWFKMHIIIGDFLLNSEYINGLWSDADALNLFIKMHSHVSAAKKVVWHTCVLFTRTTNLPFSTPHISITTGPISIKFTYFMPYIMPHYIPSLKEISPKICVHENWSIFFMFFFFFIFFAPFYKSNFEPTKDTLLIDPFLPYKALCGLS